MTEINSMDIRNFLGADRPYTEIFDYTTGRLIGSHSELNGYELQKIIDFRDLIQNVPYMNTYKLAALGIALTSKLKNTQWISSDDIVPRFDFGYNAYSVASFVLYDTVTKRYEPHRRGWMVVAPYNSVQSAQEKALRDFVFSRVYFPRLLQPFLGGYRNGRES